MITIIRYVFDVISELDDTGSRKIIYGGTNSLKVCTHVNLSCLKL